MVPNEQGKPDYQEIPMLDRRLAEEEYYRGLPTVKTLLRQLESATLGQSDFQQTPTIQQKAQQLEEKCKNLDCVNDFFNFTAAFQLSTVLKLEQVRNRNGCVVQSFRFHWLIDVNKYSLGF